MPPLSWILDHCCVICRACVLNNLVMSPKWSVILGRKEDSYIMFFFSYIGKLQHNFDFVWLGYLVFLGCFLNLIHHF